MKHCNATALGWVGQEYNGAPRVFLNGSAKRSAAGLAGHGAIAPQGAYYYSPRASVAVCRVSGFKIKIPKQEPHFSPKTSPRPGSSASLRPELPMDLRGPMDLRARAALPEGADRGAGQLVAAPDIQRSEVGAIVGDGGDRGVG